MAKKSLIKDFLRYPASGEKELPVAIVMKKRGRFEKITINYGDGRNRPAGLVNDRVYKKVGTHSGRVNIFKKKTDHIPVECKSFTVIVKPASRVKLIRKVSQKHDKAIAYVGRKTGFQVVLTGNVHTSSIEDISWKFGSQRTVSSGKSRFIYPTFWAPGRFPVTVRVRVRGRGSDSKICKILVLPKNFGK